MILSIARHELAELWRHRTLKVLLPMMIVLTLLVAFNHWQQQQDFIEAQQQWQQLNNEKWQAQPDRHPHRVAHYGSMVFRLISPLSFIDAGVNPYVGNVLFLEAHRQNSSQFKQYLSSHNYMQLGSLSAATLILLVWPLVLIALAYRSVSGERQQGTLRQLLSLGVSFRQLLLGKAVAYLAVTAVFLGFVFVIAALFLTQASMDGDTLMRFLLLFVLYASYCTLWVGLILLVSSLSSANNQSLSALLLVWLLMTIIVPKLMHSTADWRYPLPDRAVFDIRTAEAIAKIGDSHNPDDPHFDAFRQQTLEKYSVERVEELPVNWRGLVMQEGERITSEAFESVYADVRQQIEQQNRWVKWGALLTPYLLSRELSGSLAQTSSEHVRRYEEAAERYRYDLIQSLNTLHTEEIDLAHDREQKVSQQTWAQLSDFHYQTPSLQSDSRLIWHSAVLLGLWFISVFSVLMFIRPRVTAA
jgi:ABC-2 type transport system permease protein